MHRPAVRNSISQRLIGELRGHLSRVFRFGIVSGIGLGLDMLTFLGLVGIGFSPLHANLLSSVAGVTFVYFALVRRIFSYEGRFHLTMFSAYLTYQACGIAAGSWLVGLLAALGLLPIFAKMAILPITFSANYLFMGWLTSRATRWAARP